MMGWVGEADARRGAAGKVLDLRGLLAARGSLRARGQRLVHCHGCFDLIHPGHIRHLRQAKALGDVLLVSITGDEGVRKGTGRPLVPEELRAESLAALDCVDLVHVDRADTAEALLAAVKPDVYVKGREYEMNADPRFAAERRVVEQGGGQVVFTSGEVVFSSSTLIAALEDGVDPYHARVAGLAAQPDLSEAALSRVLAGVRGRRVVVVGEVIRDTYILCDRPEISGESPVMTLRPVEARHYDGGAAIVARHAASLGARVVLVTALPATAEARALAARLGEEGIEVRSVAVGATIPEKQRFLVGAQKVMRVDLAERLVLDESQHEQLRRLAREAASESEAGDPLDLGAGRAAGQCDAAIIADFGLGLLTPRSLADLSRALRPVSRVLAGDVSGKRSNLLSMVGADLVCPTETELREAMGLHGEGLPMVVWRLLEETGAKAALVTLGADGLVAFSRRADAGSDAPGDEGAWRQRLESEHVPALVPVALDPLGCGDALLAVATLAMAAGGTLLQSVYLGACAAGVEVRQLGNVPVTPGALRSLVARVRGAHLTYAGAYAGPRVEVVAGRERSRAV